MYERDLVSVSFQLQLNYTGPGEAILSRAKDEARAQERGLSSHGPLFWKGEKDYCCTHRVKKKKEEEERNESKSAWSVAGIERAKGLIL